MKTIIKLIFVALILAFAVFRALNTHFVCPKCGERFKVGVLKYIFVFHKFNKRMTQCPKCGETQLMAPEWDKKE